jgi:ABC-type uncharacterized transport system substrate-binding protein
MPRNQLATLRRREERRSAPPSAERSELRGFVVVSGGLISYGPNPVDLYRRAAGYVDRILEGAKPADLPIEQLTTFELVINLKTAQAIGLTIPQSVLQQASLLVE